MMTGHTSMGLREEKEKKKCFIPSEMRMKGDKDVIIVMTSVIGLNSMFLQLWAHFCHVGVSREEQQPEQ